VTTNTGSRKRRTRLALGHRPALRSARYEDVNVCLRREDRNALLRQRTAQDEHYRARRLAGIVGYTLHDHRHTAAVYLARAGMPLPQLAQQLGHATIAMTLRYARFHADYADVGRYFDRVRRRWGAKVLRPRCNPGCSRQDRVTRAARAARQRAVGQRIGQQARQESNLQPPVLETGALPIELRT